MILDRRYLTVCSKIIQLVVIKEHLGISTCRVVIAGTFPSKTGDFIFYGVPFGGRPRDMSTLLRDFRIDIYTTILSTMRQADPMPKNSLQLFTDDNVYGLGFAIHELEDVTPNAAQKAERKAITTSLWETYCVPVIKGGVVR